MLHGDVTVGKSEGCRTIMVHARHILVKLILRRHLWLVPRHVCRVIWPIDAVLALVRKYPGVAWSGRPAGDQVRGFHINRIVVPPSGVPRSFGRISPTVSPQEKVHRD